LFGAIARNFKPFPAELPDRPLAGFFGPAELPDWFDDT